MQNFPEGVQLSQGGAEYLQGVNTPPLDPARHLTPFKVDLHSKIELYHGNNFFPTF